MNSSKLARVKRGEYAFNEDKLNDFLEKLTSTNDN